jgi:hypothetical protein
MVKQRGEKRGIERKDGWRKVAFLDGALEEEEEVERQECKSEVGAATLRLVCCTCAYGSFKSTALVITRDRLLLARSSGLHVLSCCLYAC